MIAFTVLAILAFGCCSTFAVDCTDLTSMQNEQLKCFTSQGLQVNGAQLQNSVQNDPKVACQDKDKYKQAMKCMLNIARQCMVQLGQPPSIIPDPDRSAQGIDYLCSNVANIDTQCVKDKNSAMQVCGVNKAKSAFSGMTSVGVKETTCKTYDIGVECMEESLAPCPLQTKTVLVRYTQTYLIPTACAQNQSQVSVSPGSHTTMAPLSTFTLVTGTPSLPYASCSSKDTLQAALQQCYKNEGLHLVMPEFTLYDGKKITVGYLDILLYKGPDYKDMCRNQLGQYQRAAWCVMELTRNCMPAGYKNHIPSGRQVQELLVSLCNHVDDIDQQCASSRTSPLFNCIYSKAQNPGATDAGSLLCNAIKITAACQKEELYSCGCKTTSMYTRMYRDYLNPTACTPVGVTPYQCNKTTGDYLENAGMQRAVSLGLLAVSAVLALRSLV